MPPACLHAHRLALSTALTLLLVLAACGSTSDASPVSAPINEPRLADQREIEPLIPGSLIVLGPTELTSVATGAFVEDPDTDVVDAWLRELLAVSEVLDVAAADAGVQVDDLAEFGTRTVRVTCAIDSVAGVWTTRLEEGHRPPRPLASVRAEDRGGLDATVSELAARTRIALGDQGARRAPMPTPLTVYSSSVDCVLTTERGRRLQRQGSISAARIQFENALGEDPGCTLTLACLLAVELELGGDPRSVRSRARSALRGLNARTSPSTQHRLARVFLLSGRKDAPASPGPTGEADVFAQLGQLADEALQTRPHDPHARYTKALSLNFSRRFGESAPMLRALQARWPKQARVAYHLCFAELAAGNAEDALIAIRSAARGLPPDRDVLPRAVALYESGRLDELDTWLQRLARRAEDDTIGQKLHDVRRMQASLAILRGRPDVAAAFLLADLDWMHARPSKLQTLAADLAEQGEVLVLTGYAKSLEEPLAALQDLQVDSPAVGNALVFLAGLTRMATGDGIPHAALRELEQRGARAWLGIVRSTIAREAGDVTGEVAQLGDAIQVADTPLTRARLARALRASGRLEYADRLITEMRTRVGVPAIDLRRPRNHPLFQPGLALALLTPTSQD